MNVLVVGGGGFLGFSISKKLIKNGHSVTSLSRSKYPKLKKENIEHLSADITNYENLKNVLGNRVFDCLIHTAASTSVFGKWDHFYNINVVGTDNLLKICKENKIQKFIYTSSPSVVFGKNSILGADETIDYPKEYLSMYAKSKAMAEQNVLNEKEIKTISLRPHLIWGPGDPHILPRLIEKSRKGLLKQIGDGENIVDIIHVENAAQAHCDVLEKMDDLNGGEAYFLGQDRPVKLWEFINQMLEAADAPRVTKKISFKVAYGIGSACEIGLSLVRMYQKEPPMTRFVALQMAKSHYFSHQKAKDHFGYNPVISIEDGLKNLF